MVDRTTLGTATLTRVVEWQVDYLPLALFPQTPPEAWQELGAEFSPTFWTDQTWRIALQTWVIETDGLTVLVDTGAGNDRDRAAMPPLHHLDTDFLGALQRAGVSPESVDVVVNTHLHSDHVGWNTKRDNDSWVPTFPNARYVIPEADYRHFNPENAEQQAAGTNRRRAVPTGSGPDRVGGQHRTCRRRGPDPAVGRRPSDQRVASATSCRRATARDRRCCGWTPASPPYSSAT